MQEKNADREQLLLEKVKKRVRDFAERYDLSADTPYFTELRKSIATVLAETRMSLDLYGIYHETDKASLMADVDSAKKDFYPGHDYLRYYELLFSPFRFQELLLLEFGCARGASLRMWEDYFPKARMIGVDIDEPVRRFETDRTHIVIGNAASPDTCRLVRDSAKERLPFIIIDDASHAWSEQRRSLELFWDMLAPGGFYVIEDLECGTYGAYKTYGYTPELLDAQPFFDFILQRCQALRYPLFSKSGETNQREREQLPPQIRKIEEELDACLFIHGALILRKR